MQEDVEPYYKAYRKLAELINTSKQKVMLQLSFISLYISNWGQGLPAWLKVQQIGCIDPRNM